MRRFLVGVALLAVFTLVVFPSVSQAADRVHVGGGGTGAFTDPRFEGGTTQFAMGVNIESDGTAKGNFACIITGVLSLHVMADTGTVHDDGTVTFSGWGIVHFAGGGTMVDYFTVDAKDGGAGVGAFCLGPPTFPDTDCDEEVVVNGGIVIK